MFDSSHANAVREAQRAQEAAAAAARDEEAWRLYRQAKENEARLAAAKLRAERDEAIRYTLIDVF